MHNRINNTEILNNRIKDVFQAIKAEHDRGEIKTESDMLHKLFVTLRQLYESIGQPSFQARKAMAAPVSSDYNSMIKEFINDTNFIIKDAEAAAEGLTKAFASIDFDREMLKNQIRYLLKRIDVVSKNPEIENGVVINETFTTESNFDRDRCSLPPAEINTVEGFVTLGRTMSNDLTPSMEVSITKSNGTPGNAHVISISGDAIRFEGEDGLNCNPMAIKDQMLDTWYEQEAIKISSDDYDLIEGYGVSFKEGLSWITEDNKLSTEFTLEMPEAAPANWISLSPYIAEHRGSSPAFITSIIIDDNKGMVQTLNTERIPFDDDVVLVFERQDFKFIKVMVEQDTTYDVNIGHKNYFEMDNQNKSLFTINTHFTNRIEGPLPSVMSLGMTYDPSAQSVVHPSTKLKASMPETDAKAELFDIQDVDDQTVGTVNILNAERYHMGIRGIQVSNNEFKESGEYVSKPFVVTKPIAAIEFDANEFIPEGFSKDSLAYEISIDGGAKWYSITPMSRGHLGLHRYAINENIPIDSELMTYVNVGHDVYSFMLKAVMKRPAESKALTPIIKDVTFKVTFRGDQNEY